MIVARRGGDRRCANLGALSRRSYYLVVALAVFAFLGIGLGIYLASSTFSEEEGREISDECLDRFLATAEDPETARLHCDSLVVSFQSRGCDYEESMMIVVFSVDLRQARRLIDLC